MSENLTKASAQVNKLKSDHDQLSAEHDALLSRVAALQMQLRDTASHRSSQVELLPFARQVLELSSKSGTLSPAQLQGSLTRLAIDAITQAEGVHALPDLRSKTPKNTTRMEPGTASVATPLRPPPWQTAPAPASSVTAGDQKSDGSDSELRFTRKIAILPRLKPNWSPGSWHWSLESAKKDTFTLGGIIRKNREFHTLTVNKSGWTDRF